MIRSNSLRFKPWICIGCGLKQSGKKSSCGTCGRLKLDQVVTDTTKSNPYKITSI